MNCPYCGVHAFVEISHLNCTVRHYCPEHGLICEEVWSYEDYER